MTNRRPRSRHSGRLGGSVVITALASTVACRGSPAPAHAPTPTVTIGAAPSSPSRYALVCPDAVAADCPRVRVSIDAALAALAAEFDDVGGAKLLDGIDLRITLEATARRSPLFVIDSGVDNDRYYARVTLQAPSTMPSDERSVVGEPLDFANFEKNTAHELSTIFLDRATRAKPEGWRFFGAPSWFVQGFEEYLALTHSTGHARAMTLPKYVAIVRADRSRIRFSRADLGFAVRDPYVDGAVLVGFLHETFGRASVHAVLRSPAPTFEQAIESELGATSEELLERFWVWVDAR